MKATQPRRRIKQNIWGNWKGYVGTRKVMDFGIDSLEAEAWLKTGGHFPTKTTLPIVLQGPGSNINFKKEFDN